MSDIKYDESVIPVLSSYRITLPQDWREKYGVTEKSKVKILTSDQTSALIVVPVDIQVIVKERQPADISSEDLIPEEQE